MPPSQNKIYRNLNVIGRLGRAKTREYNDWLSEMDVWAYSNPSIKKCRAVLQGIVNQNMGLYVSVDLFFNHSSIFCKDGRPRRNDTANRLKALHDGLSRILDIDDKYFWAGSFNKSATEKMESVSVTLNPYRIH